MAFFGLIHFGKKKPVRTGKPAIVRPLDRALASLLEDESKDVGEIADEMNEHYQVQLGAGALESNIQSVAVNITCESREPRAVALADHCERLWCHTLPLMMQSISHGRVAFEKQAAYDKANNLHYIESLDPLPYKETTMRLNEGGGFDGIVLKYGKRKDQEIVIDEAKAWWQALGATRLNPHGKSLYIGAPYVIFKALKIATEQLALIQERHSVGGGVIYHPITEEDEQSRQPWDVGEWIQELIGKLKAGGWMLFPNTVNPDTKLNEYRVDHHMEVLDTTPLINVITWLETALLRAFRIPEKTLTEGDAVGSHAMVKQQTLILYAVIDALLWQMCSSFQKYVIDKQVDQNWEPDDPNRPEIKILFPRLAERPDSIISDVCKALLSAASLNPIALCGGIKVAEILEQGGIPVAEDFQAKLDAFVKTEAAAKLAQQQQQAQSRFGGQADMANPFFGPVNSLTGPYFPDDVPTRDELETEVAAQLATVWKRFREQCLTKHYDAAWATLKTIREFQVDTTVAGKVVGMLVPWKPKLESVHAIDLAFDESKHHRDHGKFSSGGVASGIVRAIAGGDKVHPTKTEAFKKWFGDWEHDPANASKVVDADGKPLVVFHGTPNSGFSSFNSKAFPHSAGYFAVDPLLAHVSATGGAGDKPNAGVYPAFLSIKNPLDIRHLDGSNPISLNKFADSLPFTVSEQERRGISEKYLKDGHHTEQLPWSWAGLKEVNELARKHGHDGIAYNEFNPAVRRAEEDERQKKFAAMGITRPRREMSDAISGEAYIAFHPHQIKSATGNRGTFDPHNPNINMAADGNTLDLAATIAPHLGSYDRPFRGFHFPWLESAVEFLHRKQILTAPVSVLQQEGRQIVFKAGKIDDIHALNQIRLSLAGSLEEGHDVEAARQSLEARLDTTLGKLGLTGPQFENTFRTNIHQAFITGMSGSLNSPVVKAEFPAIRYFATADSRTRDWHKWLGGLDSESGPGSTGIFVVGSPAYDMVQKALMAWGCRCSETQINNEQLTASIPTNIEDFPAWVIKGIEDDYAAL